MITYVRKLLGIRPYVPFTIVTTGGSRYEISSPEHTNFSPSGKRLHIWFDDDSGVTVPGLHIASIEESVKPHEEESAV